MCFVWIDSRHTTYSLELTEAINEESSREFNGSWLCLIFVCLQWSFLFQSVSGMLMIGCWLVVVLTLNIQSYNIFKIVKPSYKMYSNYTASESTQFGRVSYRWRGGPPPLKFRPSTCNYCIQNQYVMTHALLTLVPFNKKSSMKPLNRVILHLSMWCYIYLSILICQHAYIHLSNTV